MFPPRIPKENEKYLMICRKIVYFLEFRNFLKCKHTTSPAGTKKALAKRRWPRALMRGLRSQGDQHILNQHEKTSISRNFFVFLWSLKSKWDGLTYHYYKTKFTKVDKTKTKTNSETKKRSCFERLISFLTKITNVRAEQWM